MLAQVNKAMRLELPNIRECSSESLPLTENFFGSESDHSAFVSLLPGAKAGLWKIEVSFCDFGEAKSAFANIKGSPNQRTLEVNSCRRDLILQISFDYFSHATYQNDDFFPVPGKNNSLGDFQQNYRDIQQLILNTDLPERSRERLLGNSKKSLGNPENWLTASSAS